MIKKISHKKKLLAMIVEEKKYFKPGVNFVTPNKFSLQLGFINHKSDTYIKPHTHNNYLRKIKKTTEILLIRNGSLRVDFYWDNCAVSDEDRSWIKEIGLNCPVALSLHPDLKQEITFHF